MRPVAGAGMSRARPVGERDVWSADGENPPHRGVRKGQRGGDEFNVRSSAGEDPGGGQGAGLRAPGVPGSGRRRRPGPQP